MISVQAQYRVRKTFLVNWDVGRRNSLRLIRVNRTVAQLLKLWVSSFEYGA